MKHLLRLNTPVRHRKSVSISAEAVGSWAHARQVAERLLSGPLSASIGVNVKRELILWLLNTFNSP